MAQHQLAKIKAWLPIIREVREDLGLTVAEYPDEVVLSFILVESGGDARAHRPGSQFYGLLQIGKANGKELGLTASSLDTMSEVASGRASINHFIRLSEKYKRHHQHDYTRLAIFWKGGIGTLIKYNKLKKNGATSGELKTFLHERWNTDKYVNRIKKALRTWVSTGDSIPQGALPSATTSSPGGTVAPAPFTSTSTGISVTRNSSFRTAPPGCSASNTGGSAPLIEARRTVVPAKPIETARRASKLSLELHERTVLQNLAVYKEGAYVRYRAKNGFSEAAYKSIASFTDSAQKGTFARTFRAIFEDATTSWVRPLVNPVVGNSPWGKRRNSPAGSRSPGEKRRILKDPDTGAVLYRRHFGVDYATLKNKGGKNQPCYAVAAGKVIRAGKSKSYGLVIYLLHGNGVTTRYAHLNSMNVRNGDTVTAGQVIGITGASEGVSTPGERGYAIDFNKLPPHLHFELRLNRGFLETGKAQGGYGSQAWNISIDPEPFFAVCPNPGERRAVVDPRLKKAREAQAEAAKLVATVTTSNAASEAMQAFVHTAAALRATSLSLLTRKDFYDQQVVAANRQSRRLATHLAITPAAYEESYDV